MIPCDSRYVKPTHSPRELCCITRKRPLTERICHGHSALTPEAAEQEYQVQVDAGCRLQKSAIEAQAQAQTAAEDMDTEIAADWNGRLTTAAIQAKKKSNPQYAERLSQMLDAGT